MSSGLSLPCLILEMSYFHVDIGILKNSNEDDPEFSFAIKELLEQLVKPKQGP